MYLIYRVTQFLSVCLFVCLSVCLFVCLSLYLLICVCSFVLLCPVYPKFRLCVHLLDHLTVNSTGRLVCYLNWVTRKCSFFVLFFCFFVLFCFIFFKSTLDFDSKGNFFFFFFCAGEPSLWGVDKYQPRAVKQIIGQQGDKSNMRKLMNWLRDWEKNTKKPASKCEMLFPSNTCTNFSSGKYANGSGKLLEKADERVWVVIR